MAEPEFPSVSLEHDGLVYDNLQALSEFLINPIEKDPVINSYRSALLDMLANCEEPATKSLEAIYSTNRTIKSNPEIPAIFASNLYLRYLQSFLMDANDLPRGLVYPNDFNNIESWKVGMQYVDFKDDGHIDLMLCANRSIQSNVADRYKTVKLMANIMKERFNGLPRILDVGSSMNLGINIIESGLSFFTATNIIPNDEQLLNAADIESQVFSLLEQPTTIGPSAGVDLFWPGDVLMARWIKACSHYPSELNQKGRVEQFDSLASYKSDNIDFIWADFANPIEITNSRVRTALPEAGTVDIAVLSTILYQLKKEDQHKMLDRAYKLLSDTGVLIVQDFVVVHDTSPNELNFSPWKHRTKETIISDPFPYKAYVWDKTEEDAGFQNLLSWSDGRCENVRPEKYLLSKLGMISQKSLS